MYNINYVNIIYFVYLYSTNYVFEIHSKFYGNYKCVDYNDQPVLKVI